MMTSKAAKIWRRTRVGGLLAVILGLILWAAYRSETGFVVWVGGALLAVGSVYEVARLERLVPRELRFALGLGLFLSLSGGIWHFAGWDGGAGSSSWTLLPESYPSSAGVLAAYGWGALGVLLFWLARSVRSRDPRVRRAGPFLVFLALWLFAPLPALAEVWRRFGPEGLLALVLLSKIGDVFGYYVGSALGRSHPFPRISPGKTTAGCVASLFAGGAAGVACVWLGLLPSETAGVWAGLFAGVLTNLAAQGGDLLESKVKRAAGVKDSGAWFGPSGGVLDLVDSLLVSIPVALVTWPMVFP